MQKRNILDYLEENVSNFSDKVALESDRNSLTFLELWKRAQSIGSFLVESGFERSCVLIFMDRSPDAVCSLFGVLYAGGSYAFVDTEAPHARGVKVLDTLRAGVIICDMRSKKNALTLEGRAEIFCYEEMVTSKINRSAIMSVRDRMIDTDPAYIVFTSGSTGEPKGICVSHRSVIDYAEALADAIGFDSKTVFGNQAPLYYDAPLKEILPMLAFGARINFIPRELFLFPVQLCRYIVDNGINTLCWAASALANLSAIGALNVVSLEHLRIVCFGSEVFSRAEYEKWREFCPKTVFYNLYGPTEATGMSAYWRADRTLSPNEPIPIGKPFKNTDIFLIDDNGKRADVGEIYIRGSCVTNGYFSSADKTKECFVQNPLNRDYPEIVYRTGDMARVNGHGELVYLGRKDAQIKHMGRRIEPYEIEYVAEYVEGVSVARCVYCEDAKRILLAYIGEIDQNELKKEMLGRLPRYMCPSSCYRLEKMPRLANGKTDRRTLLSILAEKERKCKD